mgnify:FL=1
MHESPIHTVQETGEIREQEKGEVAHVEQKISNIRKSIRKRMPNPHYIMTAVNCPHDDKEEINKMSIFSNYEGDIYGQITAQGEICNEKQQGKQVHDRKNIKQLQEYHRNIDKLATQEYDDYMWTPLKVLNHRSKKYDPTGNSVPINIQWMNGDTGWVTMESMRLQDPMVLIKYAIQKRLCHLDEWIWVKEYLEPNTSLHAIIQIMKATRDEPRYKFGVEVPSSVKHALHLDEMNHDNLWRTAIDMELKQINEYNTFREVSEHELPAGYKRIPYQIIFDVKFDLRRKARLVAGGHRTDPPKEDIYSGVVGMDTVRMGFLIAAINHLDICAADIGNAFL